MGAVTTQATSSGADSELAEGLLEAIGQLRRQARRLAGQPPPLQSLSGAQAELVRVVRRHPGIRIADAAVELGVAPNTVSTLVRQLSEAGLLRRDVDDHDRRVARLDLTPSARRRVEQWRDRRVAMTAEALRAVPAADRVALARAVRVITDVAVLLRDDSGEPGKGEPGKGERSA